MAALDAAKAADQTRAMTLAAASAESQRSKEATAQATQAQHLARIARAKQNLSAARERAASLARQSTAS